MRQGYWVECIPLSRQANQSLSDDLYSASIELFPEVETYAPSPDRAIEKIRAKLKILKRQYIAMAKPLPAVHSPMLPPSRLKAVEGWMSVYIDLEDLER